MGAAVDPAITVVFAGFERLSGSATPVTNSIVRSGRRYMAIRKLYDNPEQQKYVLAVILTVFRVSLILRRLFCTELFWDNPARKPEAEEAMRR
jgi:hypothetical protein